MQLLFHLRKTQESIFKEEVGVKKVKNKLFSYIYDIHVLPVDIVGEDIIASEITIAEIRSGLSPLMQIILLLKMI